MTHFFQQQTLSQTVSVAGTGVHSGKQTQLSIKPAPPNHGIKFRRTDLPGTQDIQALFRLVVDTSLATVLGTNGAIVSTIEHLMATFAGLCVDNALVEVDDYEIPIMDGSAKIFTQLIKKAGIEKQSAPKHFLIIKKPIEVIDNDKSVIVHPGSGFKITCNIDFEHHLIGKQKVIFDRTKNNFEKEISCARTFGFIEEQELLKKFNLGKGAGLDNVIVIDKDRILNEEGLRYPDEFVRHKLLDSLGDFSLLGMPIQGHIITNKSGHTLNHLFIEKILENKNAWETGPAKL